MGRLEMDKSFTRGDKALVVIDYKLHPLFKAGDEVAEARIDYISDHLGIVKEEVIQIVSLSRDEKILADSQDLNAFIKKKDSKKNSLSILKTYGQIEKFLLTIISDEEKIIHLKGLNEQAEASACEDVLPNKIKTILNLWAIKNWIRRQTTPHSKNHLAVLTLFDSETLTAKLKKRNDIAQFILDELYDLSKADSGTEESSQEEVPVAFSVLELKDKYARRSILFRSSATTEEIEDALFHIYRIIRRFCQNITALLFWRFCNLRVRRYKSKTIYLK